MTGVAVFPTLYSTNSSTVAVSGGKEDAVRTTVGSKISEPNFVDNAIYHAIYKKSTDSSGREYTLTKPLSSDFQVLLAKQYGFMEEEESLLLTHAVADGVKSDTPAFFNDIRMETGKTPPMLLFAGDSKIRASSITTAAKGSRLNLSNLKGKTLEQLGLDGDVSVVQAGQIVNVGLRTTDVVLRLFRGKTHSLNSVSLGRPFTGASVRSDTPYKGNNTITHSTTFLSANYVKSTIPNIMRTLGRNDGYTLVLDRFGNLIYAPDIFGYTDTTLRSNESQGVERSNVSDAPNRVVVSGVSVAINDENEVTLDDVEKQKMEGSVKARSVYDPTATSLRATRRSASHLLRLNRKATGMKKVRGTPRVTHLEPGNIISFRDMNESPKRQQEAIIEVMHDLVGKKSDIQLMSYETGLERVLGDSANQAEASSEEAAVSGATVEKIKKFSMGRMKLKGSLLIEKTKMTAAKTRVHSSVTGVTLLDDGKEKHSGFLIGHKGYDTGNASGRSAIGTGLTPRTEMSGIVGTTITVTSTAGFPSSGHLMVRKTTAVAAHVAYTGKTSTTFTGVTLQAPSGGSIPTGSCDITLLRPKAHEIGNPKGLTKKEVF